MEKNKAEESFKLVESEGQRSVGFKAFALLSIDQARETVKNTLKEYNRFYQFARMKSEQELIELLGPDDEICQAYNKFIKDLNESNDNRSIDEHDSSVQQCDNEGQL